MSVTTGPVGSAQLLRILVDRQIRLRSKRAGYGLMWPVIAPLFVLALYVFVFRSIFRVPVVHYPIYLFCGLLPWTFLAQSLPQAIGALSSDADLIRRSAFRYELLPISVVGVMTLAFLATLAGFVAYLAFKGMLAYRFLPALILPVSSLILFVAGLAMLLALVDVYNRVLRNILANLLTVWFFLVPIVYRPEMARGWLRALRSLDPVNMIVGQFRDILFWQKLSSPWHTALMGLLSGGFFVMSLGVFRHFAADLPKEV